MSSPSPSFEDRLPSLIKVRPMLMLTGFLGAGKTTLLRSVLDELATRKILADVILNDRENARLDRETLRDYAESVEALTGSCVCCEGVDELYETVLKVSKSSHPVLFIELNGTADPLPLQESFTLLEPKFLLYPRWQVCVIDARHFGKGRRFYQLEKLQLETASHYYISHNSELSEEEAFTLSQTIKGINPRASLATVSSLADSISHAIQKNRTRALSFHPKATPQNKELSSTHLVTDLPKPKLHDRHAVSHQFTGCNIVFPAVVKSSQISPWLEQLPASVIRAKALVALDTAPNQRFLYERVGLDVSPHPMPVRTSPQVPCSGIFIGADLDPDKILKLTRDLLHPDCHFANP